MPRTRNLLAACGALAAVALAVPAFAQDGAPTASESTVDRAAEHEERKAAAEAAFAQELAAELGLPTDEVAQAVATVRERLRTERQAQMLERLSERLDQAVADERLTREEADEIIARAEAGEFPKHGRRGPGRGMGHRGDHQHPNAPTGDAGDAATAEGTAA